MLEDLKELYVYNDWANRRVFDIVVELPEEQLHRDIGGSFPSVYRTLSHIASAEWIWLMRWLGTSYAGAPADWDAFTVAELRGAWEDVARQRGEFLRDLSEDRVVEPIEYRNLKGDGFRGPLFEMLKHVANHSTYHRGQVAMMIRQVGGVPVNTDMIRFYRERGSQKRI